MTPGTPLTRDDPTEAAGPSRHILAADFALRLARLWHVTGISVDVAGGPEAAEAARRVLEELAPLQAPEDAPGKTALARVVGAQGGELRPAGVVTKA